MRKGFTLIELVMVIVILGILAATALPRFIDLSSRARENAARATLGNLRAAVAIQYASNAVFGTASYPTTVEATMFSDNRIPSEPYSASSAVSVVGSGTVPTTATGGWMYDSALGRVYINDTTSDRHLW